MSRLQFVPRDPCLEPRCEREADHDDTFGHWYTVYDDEGLPAYPVQWGHRHVIGHGPEVPR